MRTIIASGPSTSEVTRTQAVEQLVRSPEWPRTRLARESLSIDEVDGRWVAAFVHDAGAPPFGAPADDDEEAPGPKSEGPDDTGPDDSDGPPSPDAPPKKEDKGGDKGGEKKEIAAVLDMLTQIATALGLPIGAPAAMPGEDSAPMPPGGPPPGPPMPGEEKQHIVHERSLKPGEVPPGGTPVGAPAFSSVDPRHPWAHVVGHVATMDLDEAIGDTPMPQVYDEVDRLAKTAGFKVKQLYEYVGDAGERRARGQVSIY